MNFKKIYVFFLLFFALFTYNKPKLTEFAFNHFSQFGEDGIIQKIFEIIGTTSKICVEFGAHDGLHCSNTAYLWGFQNWRGILIEGRKDRFNELSKISKKFNCITVHLNLGLEKNNSIDFVLNALNLRDEIDLMSIDVDGNDYHIFKHMKCKPRVIICEYNPTIPHDIELYQEYNTQEQFGCSIEALKKIAEEKNYQLIALTDCNCFFVDKKYVEKFADFELDISKLVIEDYLKYLITDQNGNPIIIGKNKWTPYGIKKSGYKNKLIGNCNFLSIDKIILDSNLGTAEWSEFPDIEKEFTQRGLIRDMKVEQFKQKFLKE